MGDKIAMIAATYDRKIVEESTHTELVARDGLYARLARLQFQGGAGTDGNG